MVDAPYNVKNKRPESLTRVIFRRGVTINLGDYNGERIDVGLEPVCPTKARKIDGTYEWARDWVLTRLDREVGTIHDDEDDD
jgi:hypothetical protein